VNATATSGGLQSPPGSGLVTVYRVTGIGSTTTIGGACWAFTYGVGTTSTELAHDGIGYIPNTPGTYYYRGRFQRNSGMGYYTMEWTTNTVTVHVWYVEITDAQGNPITSKHTTCTGRLVDLHTQMTPSGILGTYTCQWTVPGMIVKNYSNGVKTSMTSSDLNQTDIQYYWYDGGNDRDVQFNATYDTASMWDYVLFDVQTPALNSFTHDSNPISISVFPENPNVKTLTYGVNDEQGYSPGMICDASVTAPALFGGKVKIVQTMKYDNRIKAGDPNDPIPWRMTSNGNWELDTVDPALEKSIYPGATKLLDFDDAPGGAPLLSNYFWASANEQFETYVMFQPTGGIYVPVGLLTWGWTAVADKQGDYWDLGVIPDNPDISQWTEDQRHAGTTTNFPTWTVVGATAWQQQGW